LVSDVEQLVLGVVQCVSDDGEPMWVSKNGEGLEPVAPLRQRQSRWRSGFDLRLFGN